VILRTNLFTDQLRMMDANGVRERKGNIPQALQIGLPSPFLRQRGVTVVWQFAHDGPPAAAKTARDEVDDARVVVVLGSTGMVSGCGRDAAAADIVFFGENRLASFNFPEFSQSLVARFP